MDVNITTIYHKKIRLFLVFFCVVILFSCKNDAESRLELQVDYKDTKATSVTFLSTSSSENLQLFLQGTQDTPILGDFETINNELVFRPLIPFSMGNTYEIYHKNVRIGVFTIDTLNDTKKPSITAIYPSTDTIPENLLKMYLVFSRPMQEVQNALNFIEVYNVTDDTTTTIFLELENELWNANHTELTLWLDPGRIKTDLIPNRTKGLPLEAEKHYTVTISSQWKDAENTKLDSTYVKHLYVAPRDSSKIIVDDWIIKTSIQGTFDALILDTTEPLDAMLALETIRIVDEQKNDVDGAFSLLQKERVVVFIPTKPWKPGSYSVPILSILEDLAGNNLNHLFDKDLLLDSDPIYKEQRTISFIID